MATVAALLCAHVAHSEDATLLQVEEQSVEAEQAGSWKPTFSSEKEGAGFMPKDTAPAPAQISNDICPSLTDFFENEVKTGKIPGATLLIKQNGRVVYRKSVGVSSTKTKRAMSSDTIFALRSMTKPITSVTAMMMVDEGKISLKDPVSKYIPDFGKVKVLETSKDGKEVIRLVDPVRQITIEDLLRHTSGISYEYIGGEATMKTYKSANLFEGKYDNKTLTNRIAQLPLSRQPGSLWRYGHSTDVLGRVLEIVSGKTLYELEKEKLFDPLGMKSTKFVLENKNEEARMAEPFPADTVLSASEAERKAHPEWQSGGGGLVSTIDDYAKFTAMIKNGGTVGSRQFLSPKAFKEMTTDQIGPSSGVARDYFYFPGDGFGFGYGFAVRTDPGNAKPPPPGNMGELKWDSGSGTYFGVDPKLGMEYIMLMQTQTERSRITPKFRELVYGCMQPK